MDDQLLLSLSSHLTDRDRFILTMFGDHLIFTTHQVSDLAFNSIRRAEDRLAQLRALRLVDRFRPFTTLGSAPYHWIIDTAGTHVLAEDRGVDPATLKQLPARGFALASSQRLQHLVGVNGFFTALVRRSREDRGHSMEKWWSERRCIAEWGRWIRPDGYGMWTVDNRALPFFLEYDTGTEALRRLTEKLPAYARFAHAVQFNTRVLFAFRTPGREANARRVLEHPTVPVATAVITPDRNPADAVWLPVGSEGPRLALAALDQRPYRDLQDA